MPRDALPEGIRGARTEGGAALRDRARGMVLRDGLFLGAIVVASGVLYLPGLGLYSDDWALMALMNSAAEQSLADLYESLLPAGIATRPLQGAGLVILYSTFGLQPLGYHVVNLTMLAATVVLFHLCLRGLGLPRTVTLTVPLVFALLPHYSTGRMWIAAFQAPLSVLLYLASLWSDIRFLRRDGAVGWGWKAAGTLALLGSVLAYEITALLFLLNPLVLWLAFRSDLLLTDRVGQTGARHRLAVILGSNVAALALAFAYKAAGTERAGFLAGDLWWLRHAAVNATTVAFGSYGLALPRAVARVFRDHFDPLVLGVSLLVGGFVWVYMGRTLGSGSPRALSRGAWLRLIGIGLAVFAAGYGVVLFTLEVGFDTTGMHNRTAQAAALGVAMTFVAAVGWASSCIRSERWAWRCFRGALALLAAVGCLLVNTIGAHWVEASNRQAEIIAAVRAQLAPMPPGSVVLLDGLCRYVGPGVVFETQWDVTGMLHLEHGDRSLRGDVLTSSTEVTAAGVRTVFYDDVIHLHPFGERLVALDVSAGIVRVLDTEAAARHYFGSRDTEATCPPGEAGFGSRIF